MTDASLRGGCRHGGTDHDGDLPLTLGWQQTGGMSATLSDAAAATPTSEAAATGVLTFTLTVTDSLGLTDPTPDEVVVIVSEGGPSRWIYLPLVVNAP